MRNEIILLVIGAILGVIATLFIQKLQDDKINKTLYGKLFEEIKYNSKTGTIMELTGNFTRFETNAWDNLLGTSAFSNLPKEVRRSLDSYYTILKWFNEGMLKWKKLEDKAVGELKIKDLGKLPQPYFNYIFQNKILEIKDFEEEK